MRPPGAPPPSQGGDPFAILGLPGDASVADVRSAHRRLAKQHHPDLGGDADRMLGINAAVAAALEAIEARSPHAPQRTASDAERETNASPGPPAARVDVDGRRIVHDAASFTIEALPAEAFEALMVAAATIGEIVVDDPPYLLEVELLEPAACWCRLELAPDAGSSTIGLTVAGSESHPSPDVDLVRDAWVAELNALDWADLV